MGPNCLCALAAEGRPAPSRRCPRRIAQLYFKPNYTRPRPPARTDGLWGVIPRRTGFTVAVSRQWLCSASAPHPPGVLRYVLLVNSAVFTLSLCSIRMPCPLIKSTKLKLNLPVRHQIAAEKASLSNQPPSVSLSTTDFTLSLSVGRFWFCFMHFFLKHTEPPSKRLLSPHTTYKTY